MRHFPQFTDHVGLRSIVSGSEETLIIVQARMDSRRLPGKVLAPIGGVPLLVRLLDRIRRSRYGANVVMATTIREDADILAQCAASAGVAVCRGAVDDVLGRFSAVVRERSPTCVVRVTADNPLTDPMLLDAIVDRRCEGDYDYVYAPGAPIGTAADVLTKDALRTCELNARSHRHREHLNTYVLDHSDKFRIGVYDLPAPLRRPDVRVTVDTQHDLDRARQIHDALKDAETATVEEIIQAADSLTANTPSWI